MSYFTQLHRVSKCYVVMASVEKLNSSRMPSSSTGVVSTCVPAQLGSSGTGVHSRNFRNPVQLLLSRLPDSAPRSSRDSTSRATADPWNTQRSTSLQRSSGTCCTGTPREA
uniref:Uncharacterized protein n=1 Tax=Hyaloperonospora arabidopsidis (strain Emoy2) TaxID=559515 RepID=M4BED7_HYAAE